MAKLHFGGKEYEYVDISTITLGEAMLLREYSGLNLDQVEDAGFHPGVIAALIHLTVSRANPSIPKDELKRRVMKLPMSELEKVFADISVEEEGDEPSPPVVTPEPSESGGDSGSNGSENPEGIRPLIGDPG